MSRILRYTGCRNVSGDLFEVVVERDNSVYHLDPRLDLMNHSPTGVSWGYGGSGPAQLALAILADFLEDDEQALMLYQDFKWEVIARLPMESGFELSAEQIDKITTKLLIDRIRTDGV
jgi:hypothetical protein